MPTIHVMSLETEEVVLKPVGCYTPRTSPKLQHRRGMAQRVQKPGRLLPSYHLEILRGVGAGASYHRHEVLEPPDEEFPSSETEEMRQLYARLQVGWTTTTTKKFCVIGCLIAITINEVPITYYVLYVIWYYIHYFIQYPVLKCVLSIVILTCHWIVRSHWIVRKNTILCQC